MMEIKNFLNIIEAKIIIDPRAKQTSYCTEKDIFTIPSAEELNNSDVTGTSDYRISLFRSIIEWTGHPSRNNWSFAQRKDAEEQMIWQCTVAPGAYILAHWLEESKFFNFDDYKNIMARTFDDCTPLMQRDYVFREMCHDLCLEAMNTIHNFTGV